MSNEHHRNQEPEGGKLPEPDQDRSLEVVIHDLRRVLSANGEIDRDEVDSDSIERQFRFFESEAERIGCLHEGLQPGMKGGAEHDVLHDPATAEQLPAIFGRKNTKRTEQIEGILETLKGLGQM